MQAQISKYTFTKHQVDNDLIFNVNWTSPQQTVLTGIPVSCQDEREFCNSVIDGWKLSDAHKVKQFTEESMRILCPDKPEPMDLEQGKFLIKMLLSELVEFAQTITDSTPDAIKLVHECVGVDINHNYIKPTDPIEIIAEQGDALVDMWYYALNASSKRGINLSRIMSKVHDANMNKRWSDDKFHHDERGKVIKSATWMEPDIVGEIKEQMTNGSW